MCDDLTSAGRGARRGWPRPPACLPCGSLDLPPSGAWVAVAGLVLVRQRPGTAKGVIFLTLEDEEGICNVIVWKGVYEAHRRAVIAGRCLRVTGRLQREAGVTHLIAQHIEDIGWMLDDCLRGLATEPPEPAARDCGTRPVAPNLAAT